MTASSTQSAENPTEPTLGEVLGVDLDPELVELALTHRSYAYEHGGLPTNERLEFLGDAVLGVVVTERLYREHPDLPEGQLAKLRASVVNMHALAGVARELGLGDRLQGRGRKAQGGEFCHVSLGTKKASACVFKRRNRPDAWASGRRGSQTCPEAGADIEAPEK